MMVVSQNCSWSETGSFFFHSVSLDTVVQIVVSLQFVVEIVIHSETSVEGQFYMLPASIYATVHPNASGPNV